MFCCFLCLPAVSSNYLFILGRVGGSLKFTFQVHKLPFVFQRNKQTRTEGNRTLGTAKPGQYRQRHEKDVF